MVQNFGDMLAKAVKRCGNPVVVGLDPRGEKLPTASQASVSNDMAGAPRPTRFFLAMVIDVVAELVPVVKPQAAFFEECGPAGMVALGNVVKYAQGQGSARDHGWQAERHRLDG